MGRAAAKTLALLRLGVTPLWLLGGHYWVVATASRLHARRWGSAYLVQKQTRLEAFAEALYGRAFFLGDGKLWACRFEERWGARRLGWRACEEVTLKEAVEQARRKLGSPFAEGALTHALAAAGPLR